MDIDVDLANVDNTLVKTYDGKYLYVLPNGSLDIDHYNRVFTQYSDIRKEDMKKELEKKLEDLNKPPPVTLIYDLPIGQIVINTKDAMFDILDDIINLRFTYDTVLKNDRLFYLGIVLIMIGCLLFLYAIFGSSDNDKKFSYASNIKVDNQ
jgi:hypothetical protein